MKALRIVNGIAKVMIVGLLMLAVSGLSAASVQELKAKMKERRGTVEKLKDDGAVGENNQGFLVARDKNAETQKVVDAENADRKMIYGAIAAKNGTSVDLVGKRRALKLQEKGKERQWFQNEKGEWYQKQ